MATRVWGWIIKKTSKCGFHGFRIKQPRIGELISVIIGWISKIEQVLKSSDHGAKQPPRRCHDLMHRTTSPRPKTTHTRANKSRKPHIFGSPNILGFPIMDPRVSAAISASTRANLLMPHFLKTSERRAKSLPGRWYDPMSRNSVPGSGRRTLHRKSQLKMFAVFGDF